MCFSERVSWWTLALGTLANATALVLVREDKIATASILGWQYGLMMQLPEALAWRRLDQGQPMPPWIGRTAFVLNVTQPLVIALVSFVAATQLQDKLPLVAVAVAVLALYLMYWVFRAPSVWQPCNSTIVPEKGCTSLNLQWWSRLPFVLYVASSLLAFALLPLPWFAVNGGLFLGTLFLSMGLYTCGIGSMWCWSTAASGAVVAAMSAFVL
jgi:hypothetical protein